jgi:hypothetical protein
MTSDHLAALQALTTFAVTVGYRNDETALDVHAPQARQAVARLVKTGPVRARAAYQLLTGPDLNTPAGQVSPSGVLAADGTPVGIVNLSGGRVDDRDIHPMSGARHGYVVRNPARWHIVHNGLRPLVGRAVGRATRLCFNRVTDLSEKTGIGLPVPDFLFPMTFRYSGADSTGFTVTRPARRARFNVTVHDPGLDRRMILACLTAITALATWTPRAELADMTSTFRPR